MNRSPSSSLPLKKAITGFLNYKTAEGLTVRSVDSYQRILHQWAEYVGDKKIDQLTDHDLNAYIVFMRNEYFSKDLVVIHAHSHQKHFVIFGSGCIPSLPGSRLNST